MGFLFVRCIARPTQGIRDDALERRDRIQSEANGSFTGSRLEELQRMLDEVTEEEKKRERTLLSGESIVGLSRTALSFACQHFSPSAFQCLVNIFRQNHSTKEGRG